MPTHHRTRPTARLPLLFAAGFALLWLTSYVLLGLSDSLNFDGFPADGPFQLFNPLRRIAAGQRAGLDFQFFHGIGVPFLHFPLFVLFGKTIFASELSRHFTSLACYLLSLGLFAYAATGRRIKRAFYFVVLALWLSEMFVLGKPGLYGNPLALPGNSLLGVRSTLPLVTFAFLLSRLSQTKKALLVGAGCALSLYFGTEHGLALMASFLFVGACVIIKSFIAGRRLQKRARLVPNIKFYVLACGAALLSGVLVYVLTCGPQGALQALRYNLVEVPGDQFWYFGVPPNDFAVKLSDFPQASIKGTILFLIAACWLLACVLLIFRARCVWCDARLVTTAHLLGYGVLSSVSCLGLLEKGYLMPLVRVFLLAVLLTVFDEQILSSAAERLATASPGAQRTLIFGATALALLSLASVSFALYSRIPAMSLVFNASVPRLSPLWSQRMARMREAIEARIAAGAKPVIWSTYSGLLEDRYGIFHPKDDYIIHPLGARRRAAYLSAFRTVRPQFVQTVRRSLFVRYTERRDYEQWLRNTSWEFYEDLLNNYDVLTTTDASIVWTRRGDTWVSASDSFTPLRSLPGADCLELPAVQSANSIIVVKLRYRVNNPWRRLPFVGGLPRYIVTLENVGNVLPVSLPPAAQEMRFPLYAKPGVRPRLKFTTESLIPGASFEVDEAAYKVIPVAANQAIFLED